MANILKSEILVRIAQKDGSIDIGCVDSTPMKNSGADNLRKKFKGRKFTEDWKRKYQKITLIFLVKNIQDLELNIFG